MFTTSTQLKHWIFDSEDSINKLREEANAKVVNSYGRYLSETSKSEILLTAEQERLLLFKYELQLKEFCKRFQPPMPVCAFGTSFHYFKRFYINNSVMRFHPKEIMVTCVFLACKVEEFNVSMMQFLGNLKGDRERAAEIILSTELLVMQHLSFHLAIHNPFRPVEGLLIDIKTRSNLHNPERLRPGIDDFLDKVFFTDAILLYAPSQIALAAVLHAASKLQENLDLYVTETLFEKMDNIVELITAVKNIRSMVKIVEVTANNDIKLQQKMIEKKLEKIKNSPDIPAKELQTEADEMGVNDEEEVYAQMASTSKSLDPLLETTAHSSNEDT